MLRRSRCLLAWSLLFVSACASRAPSELSSADRDALRRLTEDQVKAGLAADWDRFVSTSAPDVVRLPPDQPPVQGRDVVKSWQKTFPPIAKLQNWIDSIEGDGEIAYMRGHNLITLTINGQPTQLSFKWLGVYRKQPDGSWVMAADMWNGNPSAPAGRPGA